MDKSIAVLGFGMDVPEKSKELALKAGKYLAERGFVVCIGNVGGTFYYAAKGAKAGGGKTLAFIDQKTDISKIHYCDDFEMMESTEQKHEQIVSYCDAAIVIGGGENTRKLIRKFVAERKPIVGIIGTGGVVEEKIAGLQIDFSIEKALGHIEDRL